VKTASEITYTVSSGALNSTPINPTDGSTPGSRHSSARMPGSTVNPTHGQLCAIPSSGIDCTTAVSRSTRCPRRSSGGRTQLALVVPRRRPRPEIPRRERVHRAIGPPPPPPLPPPPPDGRGPAGRPGPGRPVVITAVGPPRDAGGRRAGWIQQLPVGGRLPPGESLNTPPVAATDPRRRVRVDPQSSAVLAARWRRGASRSRKDTTR